MVSGDAMKYTECKVGDLVKQVQTPAETVRYGEIAEVAMGLVVVKWNDGLPEWVDPFWLDLV